MEAVSCKDRLNADITVDMQQRLHNFNGKEGSTESLSSITRLLDPPKNSPDP
jgi:hypothetical protein